MYGGGKTYPIPNSMDSKIHQSGPSKENENDDECDADILLHLFGRLAATR
jgi:hypothetical protein